MFLTLNLAKPKPTHILVRLVSAAGTGYAINKKRLRVGEKLTLLKHDPIVNKHVLFFEKKKLRSI